MDDLITGAAIDAKHSNEDQIAPFPEWVVRYGDRIGNFGGIDTDAVCRLSADEMQRLYRGCRQAVRGPRRLRVRLRQLHPGLCARRGLSEHEPDHP